MDDCARFRLIVSLQVDGEISLDEAEHLRAHASVCPSCRAYETGLRGLVAQLRGSSPVQPPPSAPVNGFGREM